MTWAKEITSEVRYDNYKNLILTNAEVVFANTSTVFVRQDGKAIEFYNLGLTCAAGDLLNGSIRCSMESYYGVPEAIANDSTVLTTVQITPSGSQPEPIAATVTDVLSLTYLCDLVIVKGVTITKEGDYYYMNDADGNSAQLRVREPGIEPPADYEGKTYDLVGIPGYIHSGKGQIFVLTFTESEGGGGQSVDGIEADAKASAIYDLQGRRVSEPVRGLYIIGGKKYVIK